MLNEHRSVPRRRKNRAARYAVPLAIPAALGVTFGIVMAVSGGGSTTVAESALGTCASASASASAAAPAAASASAPAATVSGSTAASAAPCPATSASGAAVAAASPTAAAATSPTAVLAAVTAAAANNNGPIAARQLGNVANAPVDGAGNAINLNQSAAQAAASGNCSITVPANPLSAKGLATPWQLGDGCSMANATQEAFVEATILSPNGQLTVYNPLVITAGTTAAATPAAPTIARGSQVIIDVGFNGTNLALVGNGARQGACVDALGQSLIGQVSACNAVGFYRLADAEMARGTLQVTPAGTSADGQSCLTTRNFGMVDQDQSDNVVTTYLLNANGQTAQNTAANAAAMAGATAVANGSDNKLVAAFLDPATGCKPFQATDTTDPTGMSASQALNELQSRATTTTTPVAVVPPADEMTLVGGNMSIAKTNVYRSLVDEPLLPANANAAQVSADYCQNMVNIQPARNQLDMANELNATSPVPSVGNTLATFMGNRLSMSFTNLGCNNFGLTDPVTVTLDGNQVATAVTYTLTQQKATAQAAAGGGGGAKNPPAKGHRKGHRFDNPSGM